MDRQTRVEFAMARSQGLLVEQLDDETVIYDTESKEAHCLSPLAAAVFAGADGSTGVKGLAERAGSSMGEPVDVKQVEAALSQLEERGLLVAPPGGISRRQLIRRTAAATAAVSAAPMITSIVTPSFAQNGDTPVDLACPTELCASESAGDDFCNCVSDCPCVDAEGNVVDPSDQCTAQGGEFCQEDDCTACENIGQQAPRIDSCECLNCSELSAAPINRPDLCPSQPFTQCPPDSSPTNPGPGGCIDPNKSLDGRCFRVGGDSSEPCPEVSP
jgi:hypothetical protein